MLIKSGDSYDIRPCWNSMLSFDETTGLIRHWATFYKRLRRQLDWFVYRSKQLFCKHTEWVPNCCWRDDDYPNTIGATWICQRCKTWRKHRFPVRWVK